MMHPYRQSTDDREVAPKSRHSNALFYGVLAVTMLLGAACLGAIDRAYDEDIGVEGAFPQPSAMRDPDPRWRGIPITLAGPERSPGSFERDCSAFAVRGSGLQWTGQWRIARTTDVTAPAATATRNPHIHSPR